MWQPCTLKLTCVVGWLHLVIFIFIFKALSKLLLFHTSWRPSIKAQLFQSVHTAVVDMDLLFALPL